MTWWRVQKTPQPVPMCRSASLTAKPETFTGGVNISTWVLIIHGWFYIIYLFSCIRIWLLMRWGIAQLIVMALGGVVPFLSFIVEKRIPRRNLGAACANPQAD